MSKFHFFHSTTVKTDIWAVCHSEAFRSVQRAPQSPTILPKVTPCNAQRKSKRPNDVIVYFLQEFGTIVLTQLKCAAH